MSLDERLRRTTAWLINEENGEAEIEIAINEIKQAFMDEGWRNPRDVFDMEQAHKMALQAHMLQGLMTGQEWYERYTAELVDLANTGFTISKVGPELISYMLDKAAQRASGVSE